MESTKSIIEQVIGLFTDETNVKAVVSIIMLIVISTPFLIKVYSLVNKSTSISPFGQLFLQKDQIRTTNLVSHFAFAVLFNIAICFLGYAFYFGIFSLEDSYVKTAVNSIFIISIIIFFASSLMLTIQLIWIKIRSSRNNSFQSNSSTIKYQSILFLVNFISTYLFYIKIATLFIQLLHEDTYEVAWIPLDFIFSVLFVYIAFRLYVKLNRVLSLQTDSKKYFKLKLPDPGDSTKFLYLYVLYSFDATTLVLGNEKDEETSDQLYLYNRADKSLHEFIKS